MLNLNVMNRHDAQGCHYRKATYLMKDAALVAVAVAALIAVLLGWASAAQATAAPTVLAPAPTHSEATTSAPTSGGIALSVQVIAPTPQPR
jgi:hypothetical protein